MSFELPPPSCLLPPHCCVCTQCSQAGRYCSAISMPACSILRQQQCLPLTSLPRFSQQPLILRARCLIPSHHLLLLLCTTLQSPVSDCSPHLRRRCPASSAPSSSSVAACLSSSAASCFKLSSFRFLGPYPFPSFRIKLFNCTPSPPQAECPRHTVPQSHNRFYGAG